MNLFTIKYLALFLLFISHFLPSAHADTNFSSGVTLRYFELTAANESSAMIGIGYSIKWGSVDYAIELGAPRSNFNLFADNTDIGEVSLYTANSVGWQLPVSNKFSIRTDLSLSNYFVTTTSTGTVFTNTASEIIYAMEPRISFLLKITSDIDLSIYGGYAVGTESLSEPTAGVYLRMLLL